MAGVVESIGLLHAEEGGGWGVGGKQGSGLIQPIVSVCLKCGVQQGGKQDPSKFMPLCEREEKGCGVRSWRNRIIPFTFVKGPLVFCVGQDKFKRRCHNGSIGMISLNTIDVASFHEQLKAPLFLLLGEMFGYMRTLSMRISCCNTTCYKILSMITHVVVSWMIQAQWERKAGGGGGDICWWWMWFISPCNRLVSANMGYIHFNTFFSLFIEKKKYIFLMYNKCSFYLFFCSRQKHSNKKIKTVPLLDLR